MCRIPPGTHPKEYEIDKNIKICVKMLLNNMVNVIVKTSNEENLDKNKADKKRKEKRNKLNAIKKKKNKKEDYEKIARDLRLLNREMNETTKVNFIIS